jgi:hypothetical protein
MSKVFKVRTEESEALREASIKMIIKTKKHMKESELLNCLIWKNLKDLTDEDVEKYRKEVLKKAD